MLNKYNKNVIDVHKEVLFGHKERSAILPVMETWVKLGESMLNVTSKGRDMDARAGPLWM